MAEKGIDAEGLTAKEIGRHDLAKKRPRTLRNMVLADPALIGTTHHRSRCWPLAVSTATSRAASRMESAALDKNISPEQLRLADELRAAGHADHRASTPAS